MTREDKIQLAIKKGITYDPETGKVYGVKGNEITSKHTDGYIVINLTLDKKQYQLRAHQFAFFWVNKECVEQIDHRNGVRDDNRISNLRSVTNQQNSFNRTKVKGYHWDKQKKKWKTAIRINGKKSHIGYFDNEEDARAAYIQAKEKYHKIC